MPAKLVNTRDGREQPLLPITQIGRSPESNLLLDDPRVSRRHAMIRVQDDGYWFYDLGSFNGSLVNGRRIVAARELRDGDIVEIADFGFRFEREASAHDTVASPQSDSMQTVALFRTEPAILLVSDIQGFTSLSEQYPPDLVAQLIGRWYRECERLLDQHNGHVDKFIGDAVLAYWRHDAPAERALALATAHALLDGCRTISAEFATATGGYQIRSGVALHTGKIAHGGLGGGEQTLIGDAVNVAFRIEALTRQFKVPIITSREFVAGWDEGKAQMRSLGQHAVKGRLQPVELFTPADLTPEPAPPTADR